MHDDLKDAIKQRFATAAALNAWLTAELWPHFKADLQANARFVATDGKRLTDGQVEWCANTGKLVLEISTAQTMLYDKAEKRWIYT